MKEKDYNVRDIVYEQGYSWQTSNNIISAKVTENPNSKGYRLPTEDEWKYAARGGGNPTTYSGSENIDAAGWYWTNSHVANSNRNDNRGTMPVGLKQENAVGLYDISGNVWEWTSTISKSNPIIRGGWDIIAGYSEENYGYSANPSSNSSVLGFRPTRSF